MCSNKYLCNLWEQEKRWLFKILAFFFFPHSARMFLLLYFWLPWFILLTLHYCLNSVSNNAWKDRLIKIPHWPCLLRVELWTADIYTSKTLLHTWVCQLWKWPCAPGAERRTPEGGGAGSERKRGIQSRHVPVGNLTACTARSPAGWDHKQSIMCTGAVLVYFTGSRFHQHATSVPEPGRKFLTVMVLPGAGKGASIIPLIKGCTRAGEMALLFSTSSRILKTQNRAVFLTLVEGTGWLCVHFDIEVSQNSLLSFRDAEPNNIKH